MNWLESKDKKEDENESLTYKVEQEMKKRS